MERGHQTELLPNVPPEVRREYVQLGDASNLNLRWRAYETIDNPQDFKTSMYQAMEIKDDQTVLDVGCNEAHDLLSLRNLGFKGKLLGVEIDQSMVDEVNSRPHVKLSGIELMLGTAEELPFEDESIDHITAQFMLYHTTDPTKAIEEMHRILKPGGTLAISTSSRHNKAKQRVLERRVAKDLNLTIPARFNSTFATEDLEEYLGEKIGGTEDYRVFKSTSPLFDSARYYRQKEFLRFDHSNYQYLTGSLASMFGRKLVLTDKWMESLNASVISAIKEEIEVNGYYIDVADRSWAVLKKHNQPRFQKAGAWLLRHIYREKGE